MAILKHKAQKEFGRDLWGRFLVWLPTLLTQVFWFLQTTQFALCSSRLILNIPPKSWETHKLHPHFLHYSLQTSYPSRAAKRTPNTFLDRYMVKWPHEALNLRMTEEGDHTRYYCFGYAQQLQRIPDSLRKRSVASWSAVFKAEHTFEGCQHSLAHVNMI